MECFMLIANFVSLSSMLNHRFSRMRRIDADYLCFVNPSHPRKSVVNCAPILCGSIQAKRQHAGGKL